MSHILSFGILDDLIFTYGPIHKEINDISKNNIFKVVCDMIAVFKWKNFNDCHGESSLFGNFCYDETHDHGISDPSRYFDYAFFKDKNNVHVIENIVDNLCNQKFFVINWYNKYYVIAFALDYKRFGIFSEDRPEIMIDWNEHVMKSNAFEAIIKDYNQLKYDT
jgi:hypothetical protein